MTETPTAYQCPLPSCDWTTPRTTPALTSPMTGADTGDAMRWIQRASHEAIAAAATADEVTIRAHCESHTLLEWVAAVASVGPVVDVVDAAVDRLDDLFFRSQAGTPFRVVLEEVGEIRDALAAAVGRAGALPVEGDHRG